MVQFPELWDMDRRKQMEKRQRQKDGPKESEGEKSMRNIWRMREEKLGLNRERELKKITI